MVTEQVELGRELATLLLFSILSFMGFGLAQLYSFFCLIAGSTCPTLNNSRKFQKLTRFTMPFSPHASIGVRTVEKDSQNSQAG